MPLKTDKNGMFIDGMTNTDELAGFLKHKFSEEKIQQAYDYLVEATKEKSRTEKTTPLRIFWHHQLRNAILPVVTILGPAIAAITTGGFVVELVFAIPGLGRYFVEAVQQLDYTVIMGTTVFYGAFLVFMVIAVDIAYGLVDPRIRVQN